MKKLMMVLFILTGLTSVSAYADQILSPGEMRVIGNEKVYCTGGSTSPAVIYTCHCGYEFSGFQDFGWATFTTTAATWSRDGISVCKRRAQNSTQAMLMATRDCRMFTPEQP